MSYSSEVLADSPMIYYRLGEASGLLVVDSSGNGVNGTYRVAAGALGQPGLVDDADTAVRFASDQTVTNSVTTPQPFSVELMLECTTPGSGARYLVGCPTYAGKQVFQLSLVDGVPQFYVQDTAGTTVTGTVSLADGLAHHLVGVLEAATMRLYVDGVEVANAAAGAIPATSKDLYLASTWDRSAFDYAGVLDEVAIYPAALSAERVAAHYATVPVPGAGATLSATLPAFTAVLSGATATPYASDTAYGSNGRERTGYATVDVEPPVVPPPARRAAAGTSGGAPVAPQAHVYDVAVSLPAPTLDGGRPVDWGRTSKKTPSARHRVMVGGKDVTYFRDAHTTVGAYKLTEPYVFGATSITFPRISGPLEADAFGTGALKWLKKGAAVRLDLVDPATNTVTRRGVYKGVVVSFNVSGTSLAVDVGGDLSGRATLDYRPIPLVRKVKDIGRFVYDTINGLGLDFHPRLGPTTGIETIDAGGMSVLSWLDQLCSLATTKSGDQRTVKLGTQGRYQFLLKDRTTVDATIWFDGGSVVPSLKDDAAEQPNTWYATGITPEGRKIKNGIYPGLIQGDTPDYPYTNGRSFGVGTINGDTDTGDGISVMRARLIAMGKMSRNTEDGNLYTDSVADAVETVQDEAGLAITGDMNPNTWDALYDLSVTGLSLIQARIMPLVERSSVRKWNRTSSGAISGRNPGFNPHKLRVARDVDFGTNVAKSTMRRWERNEMARTGEKNWVGTITMSTDAWAGAHTHGGAGTVLSKFELEAGMNVFVPNFDGGTLFHVAYLDADPEARTVTLSVDTQYRDALSLAEIIARNQESRRHPAREWLNQHRSSTRSNDSLITFDEVGGFTTKREHLTAGKWNIFPVIAGQEGTIARIQLDLIPNLSPPVANLLMSPNEVTIGGTAFCMGVFGRRIGPGTLFKHVGNPFTQHHDDKGKPTGDSRWTDTDIQDWLHDKMLCLYVAGSFDQPCGYWPKKMTNDQGNATGNPETGKWHDDASFSYRAFDSLSLWVAIWPQADAFIPAGQQIMWNQLEEGS